MNKEFLHMQKLAGIITEGEYKEKVKEIANGEDSHKESIRKFIKENLDEAANTGLELKAFAKQLYTYAKQQGAQVSFQKTDTQKYDPKVGITGIKKMGKDIKDIDESKPMVVISVYNWNETPVVGVGMAGVEEPLKDLYNNIKSHFSKFEFYNYSENAINPFEKDPSKKLPSIGFQVRAKETGRKGGVAATESLKSTIKTILK